MVGVRGFFVGRWDWGDYWGLGACGMLGLCLWDVRG